MDDTTPFDQTSATLLGKLVEKGDDESWSRFVARYRPLIISACKRTGLDGSTIDDVTSDVLATLARVMPDFKYDSSKGKFRGYLDRVVRNQVRDLWRKRSKSIERAQGGSIAAAILDQLSNDADLEEALDSVVANMDVQLGLDAQQLRQAISIVKEKAPKSWDVFERREMKGMEYREIANELGMRLAAVHVATNRAKKLIRKEVERLRSELASQAQDKPVFDDSLFRPSESGISKSPIMERCEEYGCQLNNISVDELFKKYREIEFLYPAKLVHLAPHMDKVEQTWQKMMEAGPDLFRVVVAEGKSSGHAGWATVMSWRSTSGTWHFQHLASTGHPMYSRAALLGLSADCIHQMGRPNGQNWFRPENRFPARVFGSLQTTLGDDQNYKCTFDYLTIPFENIEKSTSQNVIEITSTEQTEYQDFRTLVLKVRGPVYLFSEELDQDLTLDSLDRRFKTVGLRRFRRVFLVYDDHSNPVAAAVVYRGPLGINFGFLENRCDLVCSSHHEFNLFTLSSLLAAAKTAYEDFGPALIPIVALPQQRDQLLEIGCKVNRQYCQSIWLGSSFVAYYRHLESTYVRLLKAFQRRGKLDRDLVRKPAIVQPNSGTEP